MAFGEGDGHNEACAKADPSTPCTCGGCHGTRHAEGMVAFRDAARAARRAAVNVTDRDTTTPTRRDVPEVTASTRTDLPADLSTLSDDQVADAWSAAAVAGRTHDEQRLWADMDRREREAAAAAERDRVLERIPADLGELDDDQLLAAFSDVSAAGADERHLQRLYAEMARREDAALARQAVARPEVPTEPAWVEGGDFAWRTLRDPDSLYRTLGIDMGADRSDPDVNRRADLAERYAVGLDGDASDTDLAAAQEADPRSMDDRARWQLAWYRQLADRDGVDPTNRQAYGPPDLPGIRAAHEAQQAAQRAREERDTRRADAVNTPPEHPARVVNPLGQARGIESYLDSYRTTPEGRDAAERWALARRRNLGLPESASEEDVRAAGRADPRTPAQQAAGQLAWHRQIAAADDPTNSAHWSRGMEDQPGISDPLPIPAPANVLRADQRREEIATQARRDAAAGDTSTRDRYVEATRISLGLAPETPDAEVLNAQRNDTRTPNAQAQAFIAAYRDLGRRDGIDPTDELRYGPPDRGNRSPAPTQWRESTPEQDRQLDDLLGRGYDYVDAYAQVHNLNPDQLRQEQGAHAAGRRAGETTNEAVRRQYGEWVHLRFIEAETATRGHMLSPAGRAARPPIDPVSLFSGSPARARRYASEDLQRWWAANGGLMTYTQFRAQVLGGSRNRTAAAASRAQSNGRDFI